MEKFADKRASPRIPVKVPVVVEGRDTFHKPVKEATETLLINDAGALIALAADFQPQARFRVVNQRTGSGCEARVAWRSSAQIQGRWSYGVALLDPPANFWGMPPPA